MISSPFMIVLRVRPGHSPLSHPSLVGLFDHARQMGHPLEIEQEELMPGDNADTQMVRLILREVPSPLSQVTPKA